MNCQMKRGKAGSEFSKYLTPKVALLFLRVLVWCLGLLSIPVTDRKSSALHRGRCCTEGRTGKLSKYSKQRWLVQVNLSLNEEGNWGSHSLWVVFAKPAIPKHSHQGLCVQPPCKNSLFITPLCVWQLWPLWICCGYMCDHSTNSSESSWVKGCFSTTLHWNCCGLSCAEVIIGILKHYC